MLADRVSAVNISRICAAPSAPSDHVPVTATLEL